MSIRRRLVAATAMTMITLAACDGSGGSLSTTTAAAPTTETGATTEATAAADKPPATSDAGPTDGDGCLGDLEAGHHRFECDGVTFDVSVGSQCATEVCGLVIDIHGWGANAGFADEHTSMRDLGTSAGFVVIQPNSPRTAWDHQADDDRVWAFVERILAEWHLDSNRVHVGGFSMGADMTWRFICNHADVIASAAPIGTGLIPASPAAGDLVEYTDEPREVGCDFAPGQVPNDEVSILYMHSTADSTVPFEAALAQRDAIIATWAMEESETVASAPDFVWTRWISPAGTVLEFVQHDWSGGGLGGHCYPGASSRIGCGADNAVRYGEAALQFYITHPRND